MIKVLTVGLILLIQLPLQTLQAEEVYTKPENYISAAFSNEPPAPTVLWITGTIKEDTSKILGHPYHKLRVKYWEKMGKTVWILDEIGKEKYITTGITINSKSQIEDLKVLVFRESRGWEVKHDFFTQQFKNIVKKIDTQLSKPIDGITGATLSVHALKAQARMALYLHEKTRK